jgi:AcrR family transcriptional regulator
MGIVERRTRQKEEVRASILHAAWALVLAEGWQSLSIRKIADAIEYSVPVIYDHFENKEAILLEFTKDGFNSLAEKVRETKAKYIMATEQLEAIAFAYWDFAFDNKEYYQIMFGLGIPSCDVAKKTPELAAFGEIIMDIIKEITGAASKLDANVFLKFQTFWSTLHGLVSINMMGQSSSPVEMNKMILRDAMYGFIKGVKE